MLNKLLILLKLRKPSRTIASITSSVAKIRQELAEHAVEQQQKSEQLSEEAHKLLADSGAADVESKNALALSAKYAELVV